MKRKEAKLPVGVRKKQCTHVKEIDSVYDQAAPYRLVTAQFPIDALTPEWSIGTNRPVNEAHKRRLLQIFKEVGVLRRDISHRLQVICPKEQVQCMLDHLGQEKNRSQSDPTAGETAQETDPKWPSFEGWNRVVGEKAELIAGNHRVEALKEYMRSLKLPSTEGWWVCDIYDQDTLPQHLRIKLRANREDITLPDNHGQIWTELATLASIEEDLFQGSNKEVEQQMLEHLRLSGHTKFPVRRLATLWKNKAWRSMITKWCQFPIGQETFKISTFEWMASCRIDDYWFTAFSQVLNAVLHIQNQLGIDVQFTDWNQLASLPPSRGEEDVQHLFYPSLESNAEPLPSSNRQREFFSSVDNSLYHRLYQLLISEPTYYFTDIQALLKITKQDGKLMSIIISHVGQWMSQDPTKVADRDNNKPPLRKDLVPGLQAKYGEEAELKSKLLQQELLDYVRDNATEFNSTTLEHYLHEYPNGHSEGYGTRFEHTVWENLLCIVVGFAGPTLQHKCMVEFNYERPCKSYSKPLPTIARIARDSIYRLPEVSKNPALQSASAADELCAMMQPVIAHWISEQCTKALEIHSKKWDAPAIELVQTARERSEALLAELCIPNVSQVPSTLAGQRPDLLIGSHEEDYADEGLQGSHMYGSVEELSPVEPTNRRLTPITDARETEPQPPGSMSITTDGLRDLQRLHRTQQTLRQQQSPQTYPASTSPSQAKQQDGEQPHSSHTIRGSKHWRQIAATRQGNK